jgi:hypothetical protein
MKSILPVVTAALVLAVLPGCGTKQTVWDFKLATPAEETASALAADAGNLYLLGTVAKAGAPDQASWLVTKVAKKDGQELWSHVYKEGTTTIGEDIAADATGHAYAVGRGNPQGRQMCLVVKYAPDRSIPWKKALSVGDKTWGMGVCNLSGGRIAVCGLAGTETNSDFMVAALDCRDGKTLWARNIDLCPTDLAVRIAADAKDNLAVIGQHADKKTPTNANIIVIKLNARGDTLWTRIYDSGGEDRAGDISFDRFGNIVATGTAVVGDSTRCVILEYDADGGVIRKAAYGKQALAEGHGLYVSEAADIFVAGRLLGNPAQMLAFQYQPSALSVWERHYTTGPNAVAEDLVVPDDAYVVGTLEGKTRDIILCRFSRPPVPKSPTQTGGPTQVKPGGQ